MSTKYHKIQSIFKRDRKTGKFLDEYSCPEFELLAGIQWDWSEKLDGTNIRIMWNNIRGTEAGQRIIGGRTDNAQIPAPLFAYLADMFFEEKMADVFDIPKVEEHNVTLYGEGIGPKIQKVGGRYSSKPDFVLFDVRIGRWWLQRDDVFKVADSLGVRAAPNTNGTGTLHDAIDFVKDGFCSGIADDSTLDAEGLVLRPKCELFARNGDRIITKVKTKDFKSE